MTTGGAARSFGLPMTASGEPRAMRGTGGSSVTAKAEVRTMSEFRGTEYVSLSEAAGLMSVSIKTVRRRIADGSLPAYRCGSRVIRVRVEDLDLAFRRIPSARW